MTDEIDYPLALPSPASALVTLNAELLEVSRRASRASPRRRIIQPLHKHGDDLLQRMLNALQPGSYIRPHRHAVERGESIVVLSGSILYLTFNNQGKVEEAHRITAGTNCLGVDIGGGVWHSFVVLESDTVLFEVKPGPYNADLDKEFASWSPEEYSAEAPAYLADLRLQG